MPRKGITNNPNGRPQGTPNKSTETLRTFITAFIETNTVNLQSEFDKMDGPEKFKVIEKLLPYVLPKMKPEQELDEKDEKDDQMKIIITRRVIGEDGRERLEEYNHRGPTISIPD